MDSFISASLNEEFIALHSVESRSSGDRFSMFGLLGGYCFFLGKN